MTTIAVDCGASFLKMARIEDEIIIKTIMFASDSSEKDLVLLEKDHNLPDKLRFEIGAIRHGLRDLTIPGESIRFGICNEMHGFVLTDMNLNPYMDYVSWQEELTANKREDGTIWHDFIHKQVADKDILKTGMPFKKGLPSANLSMLIQEGSFEYKDVRFYTLGDFLIAWLSENEKILIHPTNAAATGLYDIEASEWNHKLMADLKLDFIRFPAICNDKSHIDAHLDERDVMFYPAIGDQQAALLGAGFVSEDQLSVNMGTGAQVSVLAEQTKFSEKYQVRPFFGKHVLLTIPHIPSGRAVNVFFRFVRECMRCTDDSITDEGVWKTITQEVENCRKNNDLDQKLEVNLSFFTNAVSDRVTGMIDGISEHNLTIGALFDSVYRKMAMNVIGCASRFPKMGEIKEVVFSGGIARKNEILRSEVLKGLLIDSFQVAENETLYGINKYINECCA